MAEQAAAGQTNRCRSAEMLNNILGSPSRSWSAPPASPAGAAGNPSTASTSGSTGVRRRRAMWRCSRRRGLTASHAPLPPPLLLLLALSVKKLRPRFDNPWDADCPRRRPRLFSCACRPPAHGHRHMMRAPPGFQGFPNLVTLVLDNLLLPFSGTAAQLQRIISSAPGLTELLLYDVIAGEPEADFESAPSGRPAYVSSSSSSSSTTDACSRSDGDLPLLEEASISIDVLFGTPAFLDTFRRISNVKKLSFRTDSEQVKVNPLKKISWKFQNLRVAHQFLAISQASDTPFAVFEGLFPAALDAVDLDDNIDQDVLDAKISDDLFANLKQISLEDMNCLPNDMWFMKVLLSKAGLLQSFVVTLDYGGETESYELEACERASPQAQLELRLAEMPDYLEDF
ncbi:hypothetical protein ZWY2020_028205 [Hordeum vulgare]|nr:hypothetical protein ZWY2020_028205 [Hordeum vulgare]